MWWKTTGCGGKKRINVLHTLGHSNRDIARHIRRSEKCIRTYLKTKVTPKKKETRGRKKRLTDQDERAITRRLSNTMTSLEEVRKEMKLPVTRQTVHNVVFNTQIQTHEASSRLPKDHKVARTRRPEDQMGRMMKSSSTSMMLMIFEDTGGIHKSRAWSSTRGTFEVDYYGFGPRGYGGPLQSPSEPGGPGVASRHKHGDYKIPPRQRSAAHREDHTAENRGIGLGSSATSVTFNPDLAPSDYHLFRSMQHSLAEKKPKTAKKSKSGCPTSSSRSWPSSSKTASFSAWKMAKSH
ncbi:unnamed protein product, partial [Mesorhabditis belari]|uniref:Tc3 transposase DNA binding domain-containing protein n=1 Tax=Mesorhabditis belari TaxID=2138241 RepID=A0AAF3EJ37_9BILA